MAENVMCRRQKTPILVLLEKFAKELLGSPLNFKTLLAAPRCANGAAGRRSGARGRLRYQAVLNPSLGALLGTGLRV